MYSIQPDGYAYVNSYIRLYNRLREQQVLLQYARLTGDYNAIKAKQKAIKRLLNRLRKLYIRSRGL